MAPIERTQKDIMLFDFFKSSRKHDDTCPLVLLPKPKPIPFSTTSSSGNKVESNSNSIVVILQCNLFVLMDCPLMLPLWQMF
jgi:hypothetical protein